MFHFGLNMLNVVVRNFVKTNVWLQSEFINANDIITVAKGYTFFRVISYQEKISEKIKPCYEDYK